LPELIRNSRELQHLRSAPAVQGRWIEWKPGDALPADGVYYVTIRHGLSYKTCEGEVASSICAGWFPHANNPPIAYWSIPLPPLRPIASHGASPAEPGGV
jgi:hypothetical protein